MPKIESEKINCSHRPCSRPAPRGKIKSVRTHSEVIEQFDSFSLLKLLFLVRNWHCCSRKAFPRQMTPRSREKTAKTASIRHRWQAWKVVRSIGDVHQRPRTPRNWQCSFAFFESFLRHFNKTQRAEVIFRLSRPVSCKNQENGSGKQWSLHAPLKRFGPRYTMLFLGLTQSWIIFCVSRRANALVSWSCIKHNFLEKGVSHEYRGKFCPHLVYKTQQRPQLLGTIDYLGAFVYWWILWRTRRMRARGQLFLSNFIESKRGTVCKIHALLLNFQFSNRVSRQACS